MLSKRTPRYRLTKHKTLVPTGFRVDNTRQLAQIALGGIRGCYLVQPRLLKSVTLGGVPP